MKEARKRNLEYCSSVSPQSVVQFVTMLTAVWKQRCNCSVLFGFPNPVTLISTSNSIPKLFQNDLYPNPNKTHILQVELSSD